MKTAIRALITISTLFLLSQAQAATVRIKNPAKSPTPAQLFASIQKYAQKKFSLNVQLAGIELSQYDTSCFMSTLQATGNALVTIGSGNNAPLSSLETLFLRKVAVNEPDGVFFSVDGKTWGKNPTGAVLVSINWHDQVICSHPGEVQIFSMLQQP